MDVSNFTDKSKTEVKFEYTINGTTKTVNATSKTTDGNYYVWSATAKLDTAGKYNVKAYSKTKDKGIKFIKVVGYVEKGLFLRVSELNEIRRNFVDKVEEIFGLHVFGDIECGKISIEEGPRMAASNKFTIKITGKSGHAGKPHQCVDATVVCAAIVMNLQSK